MSEVELYYLTADQAIQRFIERSLSPVDLMQALIARSEANLTAIAEWVAATDWIDFLAERGFDLVQWRCRSQPVPLADIDAAKGIGE